MDVVMAQRLRMGLVALVVPEGAGREIEPIETSRVGPDPEIALAVLEDGPHRIVRERSRIRSVVLEDGRGVSVVQREPLS
jgi:hypothetical protein